MAQVGQAKLEDSNIANIGSKEDREQKKHAAEKEKAWEGVGKEAGLQIWRIEKFLVKSWPKEKYGEFFGGDSYIILHTMINDAGKKTYDVFFWLGAETSQDEAGTAAYKTVELDDLLGDEPVQYREVQGNESKRFLENFPKMTVLAGGVGSGFDHVKPMEYKPRLLHITGFKQKVQVYEVPLKVEELNDSDCFVLDNGLAIYQFYGTKSNSWEKRKAEAIVTGLKAARLGKVHTTYIIDGLGDKGNKAIDEFWKLFGGKPDKIKPEEELKEHPDVDYSIHRVSDATGEMKVEEVCRGELDKSKLASEDAYIIDAGATIFVWIGKKADKSEKLKAMQYATEYLATQERPANIPITRVMEGKEPSEFWEAFSGKQIGGRQHDAKKWK